MLHSGLWNVALKEFKSKFKTIIFKKIDHNDSFSTNNNSYVNPIIDTSSEFSDHSDITNK